MRCHVGEQHFAHHEQVVVTVDRVGAGEDRLQHTVRCLARCLVGTRAVEAPNREFGTLFEDLRLRPQACSRLGPVNPDVFSLDHEEQIRTRSASLPYPKCERSVTEGAGPKGRAERAVKYMYGTPARIRLAHGRRARRALRAAVVHRRLGLLKSVEITPAELEVALEEGMTFDGSTIQGYSRIQVRHASPSPTPTPSSCCPGAKVSPSRPACSATFKRSRATRSTATRAEVLKRNLEHVAREGLHVLRRARDGVLLLPHRQEDRAARQRRLLRTHRGRPRFATSASRRSCGSKRWAFPSSIRSTRTVRRSTRSICGTPTRDDGRQRDDVPLDHEGSCFRLRCVRDVHAEADRRGVRFGDAHALVVVRGRRQRVLGSGRRVRLEQSCEALHRGLARAFERNLRGHEPVGELVQAFDPGLRSTRLQVLGAEQPFRVGPGAVVEAGKNESVRIESARPTRAATRTCPSR